MVIEKASRINHQSPPAKAYFAFIMLVIFGQTK